MNLIGTGIFCCTLFFVASVFPPFVSSENVLVLCPMSSKSHKNLFDPIISALAKKGHHVTVVSAWKPAQVQENVTEIVALNGFDWSRDFNPFEIRREGFLGMLAQGFQLLVDHCNEVFSNEQVLNLVNQHFDLVVIDSFGNECLHGLVHKLGAPYIWICGIASPNTLTSVLGNRLPPSFVPIMGVPFTDEMTFGQRMINFIVNAMFGIFTDIPFPQFEEIYRGKLGQDLPGLWEIYNNVSLILMNSHHSLNYPRPTLPDVVEIGGIQIQPIEKEKSLGKELEEFLTGAEEGFIYFSLGSMINPSQMPEATRKVFVNVLSRLKQRVLWKWPNEEMTDLPGNVKLAKWVPQQRILAHPNIKAFITHGGLLSTQEAVQHGVPVIGFPIAFDQDMNMHSAESSGIGIKVEILDLTEDVLEEAIFRVLNDTSFRDNVQRLSSVFKDRLNSPLETALYWVEYVMRHKGAQHLRSAARNLSFIQYYSLDVIMVLLGVMVLILSLLVLSVMFLFRKISQVICGNQKEKVN